MRCLTLTQPWAQLVAIGAKKIETRSWSTLYRGPLAIHAAKGLGPVGGVSGLIDVCSGEPFLSVLKAAGIIEGGIRKDRLPLGAIVAVCNLVDCMVILETGLITANGVFPKTAQPLPSDQECTFGDYSPGRYAWLLCDVQALPEPIPAKGALGLWEPDLVTQMAIKRQQITAIGA